MPPTLNAPSPWLARRLNAAFPRAWAAGLLPPPDLCEATLFAQAVRMTGLDDFGDDRFRPALAALMAALRDEAALNPVGRVIAHGSALKVLTERLRAEAIFKAHPEIEARPLAAPVVIVGAMRSGTTRLHRLLALDPRFVHLRLFEATFPVPPRGPDLRVAQTAAILRLLTHLSPPIAAIHPTSPRAPDEELGLFDQSFWGAQAEAQRPIAGFARWCEAADPAPAYAHLARLLKLIGWARGDDPARPWILKTPQHMAHLEALVAAFPDARLVFTHRDPVAVVASAASLAWHQMAIQTDTLDPAWVGAEWRRKTLHRIAAFERARAAGVDGIDVRFDDVGRDWEGAIARIYAHLGEPLLPQVLATMRGWMAREARGRHHAHRYDAADFGLDRDELAQAFAPYAARYGVARAPGRAHHGVAG